MCMEDVRLGRKTQMTSISKVLTTTPQLLVSRADNRITLVISGTPNGAVVLGLNTGFDVNTGLYIPVFAGPLILDIQHHGALVTCEWYACAVTGTYSVTVMEVYLNEQ